ncbi:TonB-dependent receptor [Ideonella margarita]|uniref:TonB-dependent siderophore receptor n=1 Tax=Ideonella margarita TaxID=2984191 RepID=A0ABU9C154_9BURK
MTRRPTVTRTVRHAVLPLGALAAGFAMAQTAPAPAAASKPAEAVTEATTVLPTVKLKATADVQGKDSLQATTTRIGKGTQELRDVPQSVTVVTERLIDDRNLDTLKQALHNAAGITFQAAEGGEEDIRVRGFSLSGTGDLYVDGMRDPALYDRDTFNNDRIEVLRGSASMLFGRGSTGGVVNQASKNPLLMNQGQVDVTVGSGEYLRTVADVNVRTGDDSAFRVNAMLTQADNYGAKIDKKGVAPSFRWGIGTADEFLASFYHLEYNNVPNYGIGWVNGTTANIPAKNFYGMASDYVVGGADFATLSHTHRFGDGGELKTMARTGRYTRDFWASTIRFPTGTTSLTNSTVINRGNQGRAHEYNTHYVQSDYTRTFNALGFKHSLIAGADFAIEGADRDNYSSNPIKPTTTVGTPNDGASIADTRKRAWSRSFDSKAAGVYAQDMVELSPTWKVVGGLRFDRFSGSNDFAAVTATNGTVTPGGHYERSDNMWSHRVGVMWQPDPLWSFHFSHGTSFNTSGDTYSYDALGSKTPPEKSRNIELGAKLDLLDGALSSRVALFHSEKFNERNRDPDTAAAQYLLSGKRHAQGMEVDFAGKLTPQWELYASWAWTWTATIDASVTASEVGTNPGLTPKHSGSVWSTYQITPKLRVGAGANGVSRQSPVGNTAVVAKGYVTADLMAEYRLDPITLKLNVTNVADVLYGDQLYRGHAVAGAPRTVQLTVSTKF